MADEGNDIRAPKSLTFKGRAGGNANFAAYFLRDLYQKGKIHDSLIDQIMTENGLSAAEVRDVLDALSNPSSQSITRNVEMNLNLIAEVVAGAN